eukprot:358423-Prymnesium_polylepis.1
MGRAVGVVAVLCPDCLAQWRLVMWACGSLPTNACARLYVSSHTRLMHPRKDRTRRRCSGPRRRSNAPSEWTRWRTSPQTTEGTAGPMS